ncbi:putative transcription factor C2H2 family [Medicago truncatula]|uniref:Putative transcription factor C2H2 family n=1 Tax=Medicago truncatula TaxID=3880 RepID=A0A396JGH2_MEDTR|nr:zinc finger protein ZAT2-like [Medicago truncatula]RHN76392.1 putative transcription factor C2H2 family [Medicago truncatula]
MDKDHKHGYEKPYEDSEKRMKRSSSSLSSDEEDDTKDEVSIQESTHQCNVCGKTFSNGKALGGHRRSHFLKKKLNHRSQKVKTPLSIQGSYNRASFDKDSKHGFENTCEESEKRIKRSFSSLSSDEDDAKDEVSIPEHECNICGKTFSNGKALGGHRRSHFLKKKLNHHPQKVKSPFSIQGNNNRASFDDYDDEEEIGGIKKPIKKPTCSICEKKFPTKNALYGHMRSHPNRDFKGLNPPTEYHKEDQDDGDLSLPKWQKRDRRGRKCIGSVEAAANLLHLRYDKNFCVGESSSNGNGKNELGGDRNSSDKQLKKGKGLFDLNESYVIED